MAEHSEQITALNTLIATTIDSINGYEDSAEHRPVGLLHPSPFVE